MTNDTVHVWLISTDLPGQVLADLAELLDDDERARAAAFASDLHRHRFMAAHGAARVIIATRVGAAPDQLRWRHGPHGKPELAGTPVPVQVSLSHSAGLAALALTHRRRVGVDVQHCAANLDPVRMADRFFGPAEARFVRAGGRPGALGRFARLWARKEACIKVAGGRLMQGMKLPVRGTGSVVVRDPGGPLPGPYLVRDVPVTEGFHAAVALEGTGPFRVHRRWWPGPRLAPAGSPGLPASQTSTGAPP